MNLRSRLSMLQKQGRGFGGNKPAVQASSLPAPAAELAQVSIAESPLPAEPCPEALQDACEPEPTNEVVCEEQASPARATSGWRTLPEHLSGPALQAWIAAQASKQGAKWPGRAAKKALNAAGGPASSSGTAFLAQLSNNDNPESPKISTLPGEPNSQEVDRPSRRISLKAPFFPRRSHNRSLTPEHCALRKKRLMEELEAVEVTTSKGSFLLRSMDYSLNYSHGLGQVSHVTSISEDYYCCFGRRLEDINPQRLVFLDTETTGLSTGAGIYAFLVGVGWIWEDKIHLEQLIISDPSEEGAMLEYLGQKFLNHSCGGLVTYNGKSYDMPLLDTRYIIKRQKRSSIIEAIPHIDLLHISRSLWKNVTCSCRLSHLEEVVLNVPRHEDIPGFLIPQAYYQYLITGRCREVARIIRHNESDILALMGLMAYVIDLLQTKQAERPPLSLSLEVNLCTLFLKAGLFEQAQEIILAQWSRLLSIEQGQRVLFQYAGKLKQRGLEAEALEIWQELWEQSTPYYDAGLRLVMYYEHKTKEYERAWQLLLRLESLASNDKSWSSLAQRKSRLSRLIKKPGAGLD